MITIANFKDLLLQLGFSQEGNVFSKDFPMVDAYLRADFDKRELIYPEDKGLIVHERQICNFSKNENFVVFECVFRLFQKGYKPEHIELEPRWQVGHGASGGRADILIRDNKGKPLLIIECKTWGDEFNDAWKDTLNGKGQLFTYAHQERSTQYICLYTSGLEDGALKYISHIIALDDKDEVLKRKAAENPPKYRDAESAKELYEVWKRTYECDYATRGLFEPDVQPYQIGKAKYTIADLRTVTESDIQPKYHEFATILRQHNVSGRENAFDKLVNLFLCKIVDEKHNPDDLQFYWRGFAFDSYFDLIDRLQRLYRDGMREFLKEEVTYIDNETIRDAFKFFKKDPDATRDKILEYFRQQKYFTNNDFSLLDVHNEQLFYQNAAILLKIVRMLQDIRLNGDQQNQFLGDMFEFFLDQGFKQTEGQYFTPLPVTRFIVLSLPLETIFRDEKNPPKVIDYACGAGHFLTEMASQLRRLRQGQDVRKFYSQFYGIEKEYRLSKVAKVSAFMYNQDEINIIYADALVRNPDIPEGKFDVLISNPPYSVKGFLETLPEAERARYMLTEVIDPKSYPTNNAIEAFFLERACQLLAPHGVAGIITPSSILSNAASVYTRVREILLQNFDVVALVELGSGTFGKTGTNTVTLFLRRKDDNPAPANHYYNRVDSLFSDEETRKEDKLNLFSDADLLSAYCTHVGFSEDDYRTFLNGNPNEAILQTEMFKEYRRAFDASSEVKALQKQKSFQQKSPAEQQAELDERFIKFAQDIEREKLYYFILAYTQPCPVIVVRSPQGTEEMKKFLGYEWSAAKGQEGIKYLRGSIDRIETPLFDPQDRNNPEKISTLIRQNFNGQTVSVPESLQPYVTLTRLVDLLDFSRVSFDKQISLTPKKRTAHVVSKWEVRKVGDICDFEYGEGLPENKRQPGPYPVIGSNGRVGFHNQYLVEGPVIVVGRKGTAGAVYWEDKNCWPIDTTFYVRLKTNDVNLRYLYLMLRELQLDKLGGGRGVPGLNRDDAYQQKIPVPPPDIQAQIVAECQAIDKEVEQAEKDIEECQNEMKRKIETALSRGRVARLGDLVYINRHSIDPIEFPEKEFTYIDISNVEKGTGIINYSQVIKGKDAPSRARRIAPKGSVIISTVRPNLKGFAFVERDTKDCVFSTGFAVLESKDENVLRNRIIFYAFMFSDDLMTQMTDAMGKASYPSINQNDIENLQIRVPDIQTQDTLIQEINGLETRLQSLRMAIAYAQKRRQAVLQKYLRSA